jgi:hypothetical protein
VRATESDGRVETNEETPASSDEIGGQDALGSGPTVVGPEGTAFLKALLAVSGGIALVSWLFLAVVHRADRYDVGWGQGAWMGLVRSARQGVLYVPLFEAGHFGGTRFMPIPILAMAGLAKSTGEYLVSGKIFAFLSFALLLGVIATVLRSLRCPPFLIVVLMAVPLVTETGLFVAGGIGADALPVALQLVAVMFVARSTARSWTVGAGALCALALFTKLSALWAPLAILIWLAMKERRRILDFLGVFVGLSVLLGVAFDLATDGRFVSNVVGLAFSGVSSIGFVVRPVTFFPMLLIHAPAGSALLPLAAVETFLAIRRGTLTLYHLSLICALGVLAVVLTDAGVDFNHLIDVIVLEAIVVGLLASRLALDRDRLSAMGATVAAILVWVLVSSYVTTMFLSSGGVLDSLGTEAKVDFARRPLAGYVGPGDTILSEDPVIPVQLGQRPVVLDAFMLLRIGQKHPEWIRDLTARIARHQFSKVILTRPLEDDQRSWYETFHFGPAVFSALKANYVRSAHTQGYFIYVPRSP